MEATGNQAEAAILNPSNAELLEVASPALVAAFGEHMSRRDETDWEPASLIIAEAARIDAADISTPPGRDGPLVVPDDKLPRPRIYTFYEGLKEEGRNLSIVARSANYVDGLTENNIAHYTRALYMVMGSDPELLPWINRWTAEEYRHSIIFDYDLLLREWADVEYVEKARKQQIAKGEVPEYQTPGELFIYTSAQELATMIAHRNDAGYNPPGIMKSLKGKIAAEERDHFMVYFDAALAIRNKFPDRFLLDFLEIFENFEMPGTGIQDYQKHIDVMSAAGVLDGIDVYNIFKMLAEKWDLDSIEPSTAASNTAKNGINKRLRKYKLVANITESRRQKMRDSGETITITNPFPTPEGLTEEIRPPRIKNIGRLAVVTYDLQ